MQLVRIGGDLQVLGKNQAVKLMLDDARRPRMSWVWDLATEERQARLRRRQRGRLAFYAMLGFALLGLFLTCSLIWHLSR